MCGNSTKDINYSNNPLHTLLDYFDILRTLIFNIRILLNYINMNDIVFALKPSEKKELLRGINSLLLTGDYNMFLTLKVWFYCNHGRILES